MSSELYFKETKIDSSPFGNPPKAPTRTAAKAKPRCRKSRCREVRTPTAGTTEKAVGTRVPRLRPGNLATLNGLPLQRGRERERADGKLIVKIYCVSENKFPVQMTWRSEKCRCKQTRTVVNSEAINEDSRTWDMLASKNLCIVNIIELCFTVPCHLIYFAGLFSN